MNSKRTQKIPLDLRGMIDKVDIFRLSTGVKRHAAVELWLAGDPIELRCIAQQWFTQMRQCGADVLELMGDGCPAICIGDAPFAYVNSFKNHVNVGFFYGALLDDPAGLLEGSGKRMRHVKLKPGSAVNTAALSSLIDAAYLDIKERLANELKG